MKDKLNNLYERAMDLTKTVDRSMTIINGLSFISILVLIVAFFLQYERPAESYFASSITGKNIPMQALKEINVSPSSLLNWSMVAVTNAYTMDFLNYEKSLEQISDFFTKSGYEKFRQSLNTSGRLQDIINNKLIASAVVVDSPVVLREGKSGKDYLWEIQLPITITYQGASVQIYKQWLAVTLLVKKVPTSEAKKGIGIENISDTTMPQNY